MSTSNLTSLKSFTESNSSFMANDVIDVVEDSGAVDLHLDHIFGAIELRYQIAVESHGVVDTAFDADEAKLQLFVGSHAENGEHTRVVVRAADESGESAVMIFKVAVWPSAAFQRVSA